MNIERFSWYMQYLCRLWLPPLSLLNYLTWTWEMRTKPIPVAKYHLGSLRRHFFIAVIKHYFQKSQSLKLNDSVPILKSSLTMPATSRRLSGVSFERSMSITPQQINNFINSLTPSSRLSHRSKTPRISILLAWFRSSKTPFVDQSFDLGG